MKQVHRDTTGDYVQNGDYSNIFREREKEIFHVFYKGNGGFLF